MTTSEVILLPLEVGPHGEAAQHASSAVKDFEIMMSIFQ